MGSRRPLPGILPSWTGRVDSKVPAGAGPLPTRWPELTDLLARRTPGKDRQTWAWPNSQQAAAWRKRGSWALHGMSPPVSPSCGGGKAGGSPGRSWSFSSWSGPSGLFGEARLPGPAALGGNHVTSAKALHLLKLGPPSSHGMEPGEPGPQAAGPEEQPSRWGSDNPKDTAQPGHYKPFINKVIKKKNTQKEQRERCKNTFL